MCIVVDNVIFNNSVVYVGIIVDGDVRLDDGIWNFVVFVNVYWVNDDGVVEWW